VAEDASITYGQASHVGLKRSDNQDAYGKFPADQDALTYPKGQLFLVADGMGGHQGGQEASQMAIRTIEESFSTSIINDTGTRLKKAFEVANEKIFNYAQEDSALYGMGTTCTSVALKNRQAWIVHVGDSRAYLISQHIKQLTTDHTRVEELVQQKILTKEEAVHHPHRNVLSRAMGVEVDVQVDLTGPVPIQAGDYFLICSDGLSRVTKQELYSTVLDFPPQEACDQLVQMANNRGGHDNVTVQVIRINYVPRRVIHDAFERLFKRWNGFFLFVFYLILFLLFIL